MYNGKLKVNNFKEFLSIYNAVEFGKKYYSSWLSDFQVNGKYRNVYDPNYITTEEIVLLNKLKSEMYVYKWFSFYCGGNFGLAANELCRFGFTNYRFPQDQLEEMIRVMKCEISRFSLPENIIGYRTLSYQHLLSGQNLTCISKGDIITDNGFMGLGLVKSNLLKEHNYDTLLKCYVSTENRGIYLDLISNRTDEQEFLLEPGSRLKILSHKHFCRKQRVIECEVLPKT